MTVINNPTEFRSVNLQDDDVNQELLEYLREHYLETGEATSYRVPPTQLLLREHTRDDDVCIVIALPKRRVEQFTATTAQKHGAMVVTSPDDTRTGCLMLRNKTIALPAYAIENLAAKGNRLLVVYVCDDSVLLEVIPYTQALKEDLAVSRMVAQSRNHPTYSELVATYGYDKHEPVVVGTHIPVEVNR